MSWMIRFAAAFAITGLIISLSFGFIAGNRLTHVLITAVISMLLSGALGAGVYRVLDLRVPELVTLLDDLISGAATEDEYRDDSVGAGMGEDSPAMSGGDFEDGMSGYSDAGSGYGSGGGDSDVQVYGDHIMVNKVPIKNEPKLIAQAIRTMLSRDE